MRVVVVEPYYGGSHRAWADGYRDHSAHEIVLVTHPARFWKWRMHGGFLTLADEVARYVQASGPPDAILASSMMDVAAFGGAIRRVIPNVPIATYVHESQFTYPLSPADRVDMTYAMKNWSSVATADLVVFNSEYHRTVFGTEVHRLLNGFPDMKHLDRIPIVLDGSIVVPVGVDAQALAIRARTPSRPPLVLWNHRWEHDKGPDELLDIVSGLVASDAEFSMAMCGEVFVSVPPMYAAVVAMLGDRLVHEGWATRPDYLALLSSASIVLSTAHQEFFGIGVVEGIAAGAHPVLPNRLVYPERVANLGGDPARILYDDPEHAVDLIVAALGLPPDPDLRAASTRYDWSVVAPHLDAALESLV